MVNFFDFVLYFDSFLFYHAMFDLVHNVEAIFPLPQLLTAPGFFLKYEGCLTGITHISEKISRCY